MNPCELQEKLFESYDGRLSSEEATALDGHLDSCQECRRQLDSWKQTAQVFLSPLQVKDAQAFTQSVMRDIRSSKAAETLARPRFFSRWAFPALALSLGSFAAALLYVAQPAPMSADGLFIADSQTTSSEWIANIAKDDQLLGSVVEKP